MTVNQMSSTKYAYLVVKLSKLKNMNIFMASVRQKCTRMYFLSNGQQQIARPKQIACTVDTPIIADRGLSQKTVRTNAISIFLMQLKNQKYFVIVLKLVRMRQIVGVKEQSRIHSGLIISSLALRKSKTRTVTQTARKRAEKKAPAVAKAELKVRLATCVKMLMLISMREKQKKMIMKLNHRMLYNRFTTQQKVIFPSSLFTLYTQYHSCSPPLICDWPNSRPSFPTSNSLRTTSYSCLFFNQFLKNLTRTANTKMEKKTMIQVN